MRIWIVSELYYPEDISTGYYVTGIAETLAREFPVRVLCGHPKGGSALGETKSSELHSGVFITRCGGTRWNANILLLRIINALSLSLGIFLRALLEFRKNDCVIVVTNPPFLPILIAIACAVRSSRSILLVHDVYPDVLCAVGILDRKSPLVACLIAVSRLVLRAVSEIIVLGRDMREHFHRLCPGADSKTRIIPNWADVDEIRPTPREMNGVIARHSFGARFLVQYSGNMGRTHGVEEVVEAARLLADRDDIHFVLIGHGAKKDWVAKAVEQLKNVTLLPYVPRASLNESLNACDISLIAFRPGMVGLSVPSRMYNVMAAGKPILAVAEDQSELSRVVEEEQIGWTVSPRNPSQIAEVIVQAKEHPELLQAMGLRARKAAETKYSRKDVLRTYSALVRESSRS